MWSWQRSSTRCAPALADTAAATRATALNLLPACLRAALAGMVGGVLAALLPLGIELLQLLQRWIWGKAIGEGLAPQRSLAWCLAIPSGIGLLLSLMGAQRSAGRLPELSDTLLAVRHQQTRRGALKQSLTGFLAMVGGSLGTLLPSPLLAPQQGLAVRLVPSLVREIDPAADTSPAGGTRTGWAPPRAGNKSPGPA